MGTFIVLMSLLPVGITLFVVFGVLGRFKREQEQTQRLLANGMPAEGRVLALVPTGTTVAVMGARHVRVMIGLEVHVPGRPPYPTQITPLVSELLFPSIQPGAMVSLRVDPNNPMNVAIAGPAGMPAPPAFGGYQAPQPNAAQPYGGQPYSAQPYAQPVGLAPGLSGQQFGRAGNFAIWLTLFISLAVAVPLLFVFVDFSALGFGGSDAPKGGWCKAATRCCKTISGASPACDNYEDMPVIGCKQSYRGFKDSAKALGKTCE